MKLVTFISAGAFIFLSAFVMKEKNEQPPLYDTKWSLSKIHTDTSTEEVKTKAFIKFDKEKKSAGGNGSCNSFGSTFTLEGSQVNFKNIFSTKMYCEAVQQTENKFLEQLGKVNRYEIKDKTLVLMEGEKILLEFSASK